MTSSEITDRSGAARCCAARIAVLIPCFNDGELAAQAVASIQEDEPIEIVVVDDASDDPGTLSALERIRAQGDARIARHEVNRGLAQARMTGLRGTSASYVFPLDADDLASPGALATMADVLDRDPAAAVCFGDYLEFGDHELVRAVPNVLDPYRVAYVNEYPPSALFRRGALLDVGGWQLNGYGYEDWDLWMSLAEHGMRGVHVGLGALTYRRRLHGRRMLDTARQHHVELYHTLRARHPELFSQLAAHRRGSDMPLARKLLYPFVYGRRRRFHVERWFKAQLDRFGIWTLRR